MRNRRQFLAGLGACAVAVTLGKVKRPRKPTVKQLIAAARQWLKRHHVRRWAKVTIIPGDGPPPVALLSDVQAAGWRWSPSLYSWVSPAFQMSWSEGDVIPSFESPFDGQRVQLYVGDWTVGGDPALSDPATLAASSDFGLMESYGDFLPSDEQTASSSGTGVAFVVQSQAVPQPDATNLIRNGSFERDVAGWTLTAGSGFTRSGDESLHGDWSGKFENNTENLGYVQGENIAVKPGDPVSLGISAKGNAGGVLTGLNWYTASGALIGAAGFTGTLATMDGTWKTSKAENLVAPSNAAYFAPRFSTSDPGGGSTIYMDGAIAVIGATLPAFFDGDTPFDGSYSYHWRRDQYDSPSVRLPHVTTPIPAEPTSPLDATLIVQSLIGGDVQVGDTFTFPPADVAGVGDDGQWYVDTSGRALYGPKDDGVWPDDPVILSA